METDLILPLMQAYLSQISSAMKVSEILAKHDNSEEITTDHLICGLIYRLMVSMNQDELQESLNTAKDIIEKLDESDESERSESDEDYENLDRSYPVSTEIRKVKSPKCNCDICSQLRVCLLNYKDHECNDSLSQRFKDSIDTTCKKYNLYI